MLFVQVFFLPGNFVGWVRSQTELIVSNLFHIHTHAFLVNLVVVVLTVALAPVSGVAGSLFTYCNLLS